MVIQFSVCQPFLLAVAFLLGSAVAADATNKWRSPNDATYQTANQGSVVEPTRYSGNRFPKETATSLRSDSCHQSLPASLFFPPPPIATDRYWAEVEYLLWWRAGHSLPPLVTTSPIGTAEGDVGILGQDDTMIVLGGRAVEGRSRPGGRVTWGSWLNPCQTLGLGTRFFALDNTALRYQTAETENPIIARPFFNALTSRQDSFVAAFPNVTNGSVQVQGHSEIYGGDVFLRKAAMVNRCRRLDLIIGYQFGRIDDELAIGTRLTSIAEGGTILQGTQVELTDFFTTRNEFHGGSIGVISHFHGRSCCGELLAKVGLGTMAQQAVINGTTVTTVPNTSPTMNPTGLLAQPSNIGVFRKDQLVVCPEIGVKVTWQFSPCVSVTAGYSMIYWNDVVLSADQIDFVVNPIQIPGPTIGKMRPAFPMNETDFWVHGLTVGVMCRF